MVRQMGDWIRFDRAELDWRPVAFGLWELQKLAGMAFVVAVSAPVAAERIGDEAGKPVTVVGSAQGRTVKGTSDPTMRVRVSQQPSVALDGIAGARRGAVDAGIPAPRAPDP